LSPLNLFPNGLWIDSQRLYIREFTSLLTRKRDIDWSVRAQGRTRSHVS